MGDIISFSVSRDGESEKQEEFVISNTMTCQCQPVTKIESLYLAVNVTHYRPWLFSQLKMMSMYCCSVLTTSPTHLSHVLGYPVECEAGLVSDNVQVFTNALWRLLDFVFEFGICTRNNCRRQNWFVVVCWKIIIYSILLIAQCCLTFIWHILWHWTCLIQTLSFNFPQTEITILFRASQRKFQFKNFILTVK